MNRAHTQRWRRQEVGDGLRRKLPPLRFVSRETPQTGGQGMDQQEQILKERAVTSGPKHHFFGYYDKQQWDAAGRYLLGLEVDFIDRPPTPEDVAIVGMVDLQDGSRFIPLGETRAWNWQQGTMLQWLGSAPDRLVIYNARERGRFVSKIRDVHSGEVGTLPRPIYAVTRDGTAAVSLNFSRVARTRPGYGYVGLPDPGDGDAHPADDGIWWMDLATGENHLIVSLEQMARLDPHPTMEGATHWFNHLLISPDGARFIFLHRWGGARGGMRHHRMFTANPDGSGLHMVVDGMVSHFEWRDAKHILAWARQEGRGDHYYLFTDQADQAEIVGEGVLTTDGHCSYSPDGRWILTDTYPDQKRMRTLVLYRVPDGPRFDVGRFFAPKELDGEIRCDLHPRWNRDGTQVCIDSVHDGDRQMYVLDVGEIVKG